MSVEVNSLETNLTLAYSEPMNITQIESLAKPPHKDRRELR